LGIWRRVEEWALKGNEIRVAVVGAGYVGRGIVYRLERSLGMRTAMVVNRTVGHAVRALELAGLDPRSIVVSEDTDELALAIEAGVPAVASSLEVLSALEGIDVVVEATGAIDFGADAVLTALRAGKDVVSMNAEVDATIGYLLHHVAFESDSIYTISDGDQPGVLLRQCEFVQEMGFDIVAAVNCKRNLDVHQSPESGQAYAARDTTSLLMTTAFGDGTKMNVENAVVANATGLVPDCRGMHGVRTTLERAAQDIPKALLRRGVVEYTLGGDFAAGVGVVGHADDLEMIQPYMRYLKMGDGPHYFFFRPYHLVHLEAPVTIAEVTLDRMPLGRPIGPPVAEVVAVAKRNLERGERLDGIGGFTSYGQIDTIEGAEGLLPIGLAEHARLVRAVPQDAPIPLDFVELDPDALIVRLRQQQEELVTRIGIAASATTTP
jgi:predicted homoserine dehydrogenase-like protein